MEQSFQDVWSIPLAHIGGIETYRTMPKLAAFLQVSDSPQIVDHVPVMVFLVHQYVHNNSGNFRWDHDRLNKALHDPSNDDRRNFIAATEAELNDKKSEWKELWDETTLDLMWSMYNDIVCSQARKISRHTEHRDELYVTIEKERD